MSHLRGKKVFSQKPLASTYFLLSSVFILIASFPAVRIVSHYGNRIGSDALQWLLLGVAAVWLLWIRVWMTHARLHQYVSRDSTSEGSDFILDQAAQLAYVGLCLVGFALLGLLLALWRIAARK